MWFFTVFSRDEQLLGDVAVVHALRDEPEDLHLAVGEPRRGHLRSLVGCLRDRGELREELGRHRRADAGLAAHTLRIASATSSIGISFSRYPDARP